MTEIKRVRVKKLYEGMVSIRSYIVDEAKKKKQTLIIQLDDEEMVIPPNKLETGRMNTEVFFESRFGNFPYYLIDFPWFPISQLKLI